MRLAEFWLLLSFLLSTLACSSGVNNAPAAPPSAPQLPQSQVVTPSASPAAATPPSTPQGPQRALTRIGTDPTRNSAGQHETAMETSVVASGNTLVAAFHVGRLTTGGVTNIGWAVSNDGGVSWQQGVLPQTTIFAGGDFGEITDPVVAYDAKHATWMISFVGAGGDAASAAAMASLSTDNGRTWSPPVTISTGPFPDKNWTVCDNFTASPYYGTCYTEFHEETNGTVYMSRSSDGGRNWEAAKPTADQFKGIAGQPVVQSGGRVVVPIADTEFTRLVSFRSEDGGGTWGATQPISDVKAAPPQAGLRASPNPSAVVDGAGRIQLTWYDCRFELDCKANGLVLSSSADGASWSAPTRINTFPADAGRDHLFPAIAADGNKLAIAFYGVSEGSIETFYISSPDGGQNWQSPIRLAGPMRPEWISTTSRGTLIGDYISVAFLNGLAFPVFSVAAAPGALEYDQAIYTFPQG